ncbi:hypothetical protein H632_c5452p0, partial [Helicosporidium sp. ATCC 50920]
FFPFQRQGKRGHRLLRSRGPRGFADGHSLRDQDGRQGAAEARGAERVAAAAPPAQASSRRGPSPGRGPVGRRLVRAAGSAGGEPGHGPRHPPPARLRRRRPPGRALPLPGNAGAALALAERPSGRARLVRLRRRLPVQVFPRARAPGRGAAGRGARGGRQGRDLRRVPVRHRGGLRGQSRRAPG